MATQRDVKSNEMFLNECVLQDGLYLVIILTVIYYPSPGPSAAESAGRGYVNLFICVVILVKTHPGTALKFMNPTEDYPSKVLR